MNGRPLADIPWLERTLDDYAREYGTETAPDGAVYVRMCPPETLRRPCGRANNSTRLVDLVDALHRTTYGHGLDECDTVGEGRR